MCGIQHCKLRIRCVEPADVVVFDWPLLLIPDLPGQASRAAPNDTMMYERNWYRIGYLPLRLPGPCERLDPSRIAHRTRLSTNHMIPPEPENVLTTHPR